MFTNLREIDENNLHTLPLNSRIFLEHKTQKNYIGSVDGKKIFFVVGLWDIMIKLCI